MSSFQLGVLIVHVMATISMVGLIWFVQVVHYPLFALVGRERFANYEAEHRRSTTLVVAPLMLAEMTSAVLLLFWRPRSVSFSEAFTGVVLLAVIWTSTIAVQVPLHNRLSHSYDLIAQKQLVRSNWLRTISWSLRGLLALQMLTGLIP